MCVRSYDMSLGSRIKPPSPPRPPPPWPPFLDFAEVPKTGDYGAMLGRRFRENLHGRGGDGGWRGAFKWSRAGETGGWGGGWSMYV